MKINLRRGRGFSVKAGFFGIFLAFFVLLGSVRISQGAIDYTWFQSSWNGSQDESSYALHVSDRTGWTGYAATSNTFSIDADTVSLSQDSYSYTDELYEQAYFDGPSSTAVWNVRAETVTLPPNSVSESFASWKNPFMGGAHFEAIEWFDATNGVAVGENGMIASITSGGGSVSFPESNTSSDLNDVSFFDSSFGWAVGDGNTVVHTSNGGLSWSSVAPGGRCSNWEGVHFLSNQVGYIVGSVCSGTSVMKTEDAGTTWSDVSPATLQKDLQGVYFNTTNDGFIVGADGRIRTTSNGGITWTIQISGASSYVLHAVNFVDASNGWVSGESGTLLKTTDGGSNWNPIAVGLPDTIVDIEMASSTVGYFATDARDVFKTNDGSSWSIVNNFGQSLAGISVYDDNTAYVVGQFGAIDYTTDGGSGWSSLTTAPIQVVRDVFFASSNMGWAVGEQGTILYTGDGGATWSSQTSGTVATLNSVHFVSNGGNWIGTIVGESGVVLKTTDNGLTWDSIDFGQGSVALNSVFFRSENDGWIVGDSVDYYTTDSGTNWQSGSYAQTSEDFQSIMFAGEDGYLVADQGLILKTSDGGATWSTQSCGAFTGIFYDVYTSNGSYAWAVGQNGTVCYTSDGGSTWGSSTPTASDFYSVSANGASLVWVAGDNGALYYSTDGGATLTERNMRTSNRFYSIDVYDATTLWLGAVDDDDNTKGSVHKLDVTPLYSTSATVVSDRITDFSSLATLQAQYTTPSNTDVTWFLSRDGINWDSVSPASEHTFSESGSGLYWKADLTSSDDSTTPYISSAGIDYYGNYSSGDTLTSSWFDVGTTGGYIDSLAWSETLPANTDLKFQIRTAGDNGGAPNTAEATPFCGPDDGEEAGCPTGTYFTDPNGAETIDNVHQDGIDSRWVQYTTTFETDGNDTPVLSDVSLGYSHYSTPTVPIVLSPTHNMTDVSRTTIFSISYVGDLTHQNTDWQLYSNAALTDLVASISETSTYKSDITPSQLGITLGGNTSYWLRARTNNEIGASDWTSAVKFTTANADPVFSDISTITFEEDSTYNDLDLSSYVSDGDSDSLSYSVSGNSSSLDISIHDSTSVVTIIPSQNYYGSETVVFSASDGYGGEASQSVDISITSVNDVPSAPSSGFSPSEGNSTSSRTPTISWGSATDTEDDSESLHYVLKVSLTETPSEDANSLQYTSGDGVSELQISSELANQTVYYYQVKTVDSSDGVSVWSDVQSFYVDSSSEPIVSVVKSVSINQSLSLDRLYRFVQGHKPSFLASVIIPFLSTEAMAQEVSAWSFAKQGVILEAYRFAQQASFSYVLLGILIASIVFSVLAVRSPQKFLTFLTRHPSHTFSEVSGRDKKGTFKTSYSHFRKKAQVTKGTFFGSILLLLVKFSVAAYLSAFYISPLFVAMGTSDDGVAVSSGDILTYQVAYSNAGTGNATSFSISDVLSDDVTFRDGSLYIDDVLKTDADDSDDAYYDSDAHTVVFTIGTLASEATGTIAFSVQVNSDTSSDSVANTATYTYSESEDSGTTNAVNNPISGPIATVGSIGYLVYNDIDRDIKIDSGESGISDVTVRLYTDTNSNDELDASEISLSKLVTTDSNGQYEFTNLLAGTYFIGIDEATIPSGYSVTTDNNPKKVSLSSGQDYRGANFGYALPTSSIGDFIFDDANNNGSHTLGEEGVSSVLVSLYKDDVNAGTFNVLEDTLIATDITDTDGLYNFSNLEKGTYYVFVDEESVAIQGGILTTLGNPFKVIVSTDTDFQYNLADFGYYFELPRTVVATPESDEIGEEEVSGNADLEDEESVSSDDSSFLFTPTGGSNSDLAKEVRVPRVSEVNGYEYTTDAPIDIHNSELILEGSSDPCSRVIVYIHSDTVIKLAQTDVDGDWKLSVDVEEFGEGEHTVLVQGETNGVKSDIGEIAKINVYESGNPDKLAFIIVLNLAVVFLVLFITSVAIVFRRR